MTKNLKTYTRPEINMLHDQISHGSKKALALYLGIHPAALSRYLNERNHKFRMPETVYKKIIEFINAKNTTYGTLPTAKVQATQQTNRQNGMGRPLPSGVQSKTL